MTLPRQPLRWPVFDTSVAVWRARAIRYVLIYLSLVLALVVARSLTQDIRPNLLAAQEREAALTTQRDDLTVRVQALETPQRVRDWAFANGMRRFADAPNKDTQTIEPVGSQSSAVGTTQPRQVEVRTQWK